MVVFAGRGSEPALTEAELANARAAVRGQVVTQSGEPLAGAYLSVRPVLAGRVLRGAPTHRTGRDGRFEIVLYTDDRGDLVPPPDTASAWVFASGGHDGRMVR